MILDCYIKSVSFNLSFLGNSVSLADTLDSMIIRPQSDKCGCSTNPVSTGGVRENQKANRKSTFDRFALSILTHSGWPSDIKNSDNKDQ